MVVNKPTPFHAAATDGNWNPQFTTISPMFEPLAQISSRLSGLANWPALDTFQNLTASSPCPPVNQNGTPIQFVPQGPKPEHFADRYEPKVFLTGEVQTRTENWHDLFNALVWLAFPKTKAAINARHYAALVQSESTPDNGNNRGTRQDAYTLFDESGVIVISSDDGLLELLRTHQWRELFWERREDTRSCMKFILFGHSLYEKALQPYTGVTGKGLLLSVDDAFLQQPVAMQVAALDKQVADLLDTPESMTATQDFFAVPLLGMPGWAAENEAAQYYDNIQYFRPQKNTQT